MLRAITYAAVFFGFIFSAHATHTTLPAGSVAETSTALNIRAMRTFATSNGVEIQFDSTNPISHCNGFWLSKSDASFNAVYVTLQMAYQSDTPLKFAVHISHNSGTTFYYHNPSSGSIMCRIDSIIQE